MIFSPLPFPDFVISAYLQRGILVLSVHVAVDGHGKMHVSAGQTGRVEEEEEEEEEEEVKVEEEYGDNFFLSGTPTPAGHPALSATLISVEVKSSFSVSCPGQQF